MADKRSSAADEGLDEGLMGFVSAVSGDAFVRVEESLGSGYVRLKVAEAERRQAKHDIRCVEDIVVELLRNARDAHAQRIFIATSTGEKADGEKQRTVTVVDDGVGIPPEMQELIFEPRVTSKLDTMVVDPWGVHGRGMALSSARSNSENARVVLSTPHKGSILAITTDPSALAERTDQSTWPKVERKEGGMLHVAKGPHNIIRRAVEFAVEYPGIDLYLGSPAEVLATLVMLARFELNESDLLFGDDLDRLSIWQRPGAASDAAELTKTAEHLGLPVSERTSHRILIGEVMPLHTVLGRVSRHQPSGAADGAPDLYRDRRGLRIDPHDLSVFQREAEEAFYRLAEKYYIHLKSEPKISVGSDEIRVRFEIDKED